MLDKDEKKDQIREPLTEVREKKHARTTRKHNQKVMQQVTSKNGKIIKKTLLLLYFHDLGSLQKGMKNNRKNIKT